MTPHEIMCEDNILKIGMTCDDVILSNSRKWHSTNQVLIMAYESQNDVDNELYLSFQHKPWKWSKIDFIFG